VLRPQASDPILGVKLTPPQLGPRPTLDSCSIPYRDCFLRFPSFFFLESEIFLKNSSYNYLSRNKCHVARRTSYGSLVPDRESGVRKKFVWDSCAQVGYSGPSGFDFGGCGHSFGSLSRSMVPILRGPTRGGVSGGGRMSCRGERGFRDAVVQFRTLVRT
jgi:hypothetical protein